MRIPHSPSVKYASSQLSSSPARLLLSRHFLHLPSLFFAFFFLIISSNLISVVHATEWIKDPSKLVDDCCCQVQTVDTANDEYINSLLGQIVTHTYFKYFKVNLERPCPYWAMNTMCNLSGGCGVCQCDDNSIPIPWKMERRDLVDRTLYRSDLRRLFPAASSSSNENVWAAVEDEENDDTSIYVDLRLNPEANTNYKGEDAVRVWRTIYNENCFSFLSGPTLEEMCTEERVFFRLLSGLHTSISTHIAARYYNPKSKNGVNTPSPPDTPVLERVLQRIQLYLSPQKGPFSPLSAAPTSPLPSPFGVPPSGRPAPTVLPGPPVPASESDFEPNLNEFWIRVGSHPDRVENLYFTFLFMLRAVQRASPLLSTHDYLTGNATEDALVKSKMEALLSSPLLCSPTFNESQLFTSPDKQSLRLQMQSHFRNISLIMNCVACEKCRVWAKLQTLGMGTALKILLSNSNTNVPPLQRNEIIALINSLRQLSESLSFINKLTKLYRRRQMEEDVVLYGLAAVAVLLILFVLSRVKNWIQRRSKRAETQKNNKPKSD